MPQTKSQLKSWQRTSLGDFVVFNYGKGLPERDRVAGPYPVYGSAGMVDTNKEYLVEGPGIVVGRKGSVGEIYYTDKNYFPIDTVYYITKGDKYNLRFLYYLLQTINFKSLNSDAAVPGLNRNTAYAQEVLLPPHPTQKQIADVLSAHDDLIENNTKRIKILEQIAQAIYKEWFVYFRFPGHENAKMIDNKTEFGKIPERWEVEKLGDKINILRGKNITKNTIAPGKVPFVAGGMGPAYFHNKANVEGPAITVSASGANSGYVNLYHEDIWASDCSYINKNSTPFVYYYFLLLKNRQAEITGLQRGSAQPHVYPKDLARLLIVDPPEELVHSFEEKAESTFGMINNFQLQNQNLRQARDLLLPKLVTGKIEVKI